MPGSERWKLLVATSDESDAYLIKSRLDAEGIPARIEANKDYPGVEHGGRRGEISVYVDLAYFEASLQVLEKDLEEDDE